MEKELEAETLPNTRRARKGSSKMKTALQSLAKKKLSVEKTDTSDEMGEKKQTSSANIEIPQDEHENR